MVSGILDHPVLDSICTIQKIDSRIERAGLLKTFIHDGDSCQLMMINTVYSIHAGNMIKFNQM
jgi:hypothetical protein